MKKMQKIMGDLSRGWVVCGGWMLLLALLAGSGCEPDRCVLEADLVAGTGVKVGGKKVCLGESAANLEARLGSGSERRDLGTLGLRVEYPDLFLTIHYNGPNPTDTVKAIILQKGGSAQTKSGVKIGSDESTVRAEFGEPVIDAFLRAWWYHKTGIVFQWEEKAVTQIQIVSATP